eukprot:sb/3477009/
MYTGCPIFGHGTPHCTQYASPVFLDPRDSPKMALLACFASKGRNQPGSYFPFHYCQLVYLLHQPVHLKVLVFSNLLKIILSSCLMECSKLTSSVRGVPIKGDWNGTPLDRTC